MPGKLGARHFLPRFPASVLLFFPGSLILRPVSSPGLVVSFLLLVRMLMNVQLGSSRLISPEASIIGSYVLFVLAHVFVELLHGALVHLLAHLASLSSQGFGLAAPLGRPVQIALMLRSFSLLPCDHVAHSSNPGVRDLHILRVLNGLAEQDVLSP